MTDRELMQQALEALEKTTANTISQAARIQEAIDALRERLAQPEQEPVAIEWNAIHDKLFEVWNHVISADDGFDEIKCLIDTTPPQCKPLTDAEIDKHTRDAADDLLDHIYEFGSIAEGIDYRIRSLARAIEAALKDKNK